jgi:hypothetical protein
LWCETLDSPLSLSSLLRPPPWRPIVSLSWRESFLGMKFRESSQHSKFRQKRHSNSLPLFIGRQENERETRKKKSMRERRDDHQGKKRRKKPRTHTH